MSFCGFVDFYFFFRNDMVCLKGKLSKMLYIKMLKSFFVCDMDLNDEYCFYYIKGLFWNGFY